MGSISGLKSILLLVDLFTCRKSDQNQILKWFTLGDFWFIRYKYTHVLRYCCLRLNNSLLGNGAKNWCVCHVVSLNKFYGIGARD